jgi:hypothetical protein
MERNKDLLFFQSINQVMPCYKMGEKHKIKNITNR